MPHTVIIQILRMIQFNIRNSISGILLIQPKDGGEISEASGSSTWYLNYEPILHTFIMPTYPGWRVPASSIPGFYMTVKTFNHKQWSLASDKGGTMVLVVNQDTYIILLHL